jgi:hypothetical protein
VPKYSLTLGEADLYAEVKSKVLSKELVISSLLTISLFHADADFLCLSLALRSMLLFDEDPDGSLVILSYILCA